MWMRRNKIHSAVYQFVPETRSVQECDKSTPWWLVDYLARRSGKHISARNTASSQKEISCSLDEFERKLGWASHFAKHGEPENAERFNPKLHVPSKRSAERDPHVTNFMRNVRTEAEKRLKKRLEASRDSPMVENPLERRAELEIESKNYVILEADKDGCWVLTTARGFEHLENEILRSGAYSQIDPQKIQIRDARKVYGESCAVLARGSKALRRFLFSKFDSFMDVRLHAAKLRMKVKTHKGPGKVKARAIHDGSTSPMGPAAAYISDVMERYVKTKFGHVIKDSTEMIRQIE